MAHLPGSVSSLSVSDRVIHIDESIYEPGPAAQLISTATDSGASPTTTIRKGNCIVKKTSTGLFYIDDGITNAGGADRNTPASVTAAETADGDWASKTITIYVDGGPAQVVTLGATDDTDAEVVAAIMLQTTGVKATVVSSRVVIKTDGAGAHRTLTVASNLSTAFGASDSVPAYGTDAEYYITEEEVSTLDPNTGSAATVEVKTSFKAYYDESQLLNLSAEARATLSRRGARFG
jgi:hypothetical protein